MEGYSVVLPDTWEAHDQARIVVFVSDKISAKKKETSAVDNDLPTLSFEIGFGREKRTLVNFYYREWTSGITRDKSEAGQLERFKRQVEIWRNLTNIGNRDVILLGDANFCYKSCHDLDYPSSLKNISTVATDFYLEEAFTQLVYTNTRTELKGNQVEKSCIDHIATTSPDKCEKISVTSAGNSDHMAIIVTKHSKEIVEKPEVVKKRSYKNFTEANFIREVKYTDFEPVMEETDENEAAKKFCSIFRSILDNHAPIKVFQTRKNYAPWVSTETKSLIEERDKLKEESTQSDDPEVLKRYKILRNKIKSRLENHEKKEYYKNKFSEANTDSGKSWKTAYQFLDKTQVLSPKHINSN